MRIYISIMAALMLIFVSGCSKSDIQSNGCKDIVIDENLFNNGNHDPGDQINNIDVEDDCLLISYSYSGGCEEHDIDLVTDGFVSFSNPPIMEFKILHENLDPCEAWLTDDLEFDLNSLNYSGGILELMIEGYSEKIIID